MMVTYHLFYDLDFFNLHNINIISVFGRSLKYHFQTYTLTQ
ncbi:hypothetical protein ACFLY8_03595 [Halobacteriota archaeon]